MRPLMLSLFLPACAVLLSSCTEVQIANHVYKKSSAHTPYKAPPVNLAKRKTGKPYSIKGVTYYPLKQSDGYRQKGVASWYGKDFHGKKTANGEVYNMHAWTAAHKSLPLPTWVRVTNLSNGRSVRLRVNDRGPFARGRIIDLSYRAAQALDMVKVGTAPVLVEALPTDGSILRYAGRRPLASQNQVQKTVQVRKNYTLAAAKQKKPVV